MTIRTPQRLLDANYAWFDPKSGRPTPAYYQYSLDFDRAVRALLLQGSAVAFTSLPSGTVGDARLVTDGRKNGEGAGSGTGVLAYFDGTNWIATDTGAPVAA